MQVSEKLHCICCEIWLCFALQYMLRAKHGRPQKFFQGGQRRHIAYLFQVADDATQMDVQKALYPFYTTKKITHDTTAFTKMRFVGSNSQVHYDNLHQGAQPFRYCRSHYVYLYELRPPQIASTRLFDCLSSKHARTVDQGPQTPRSHFAPEGILCGRRCVLGIFI